ncbi:hypothetical protein KP79_PYT06858 [Mizuhopecten yessoensis]|uniref:Uncharacterized protein n=1 Tax=Mizuhopecten yessoensis TaxID=6573 RepID=A0A210QUS5_MIZYE|nr:hypothetical protein KP79_PYT06858 [Mizuhopecten yessoensis]
MANACKILIHLFHFLYQNTQSYRTEMESPAARRLQRVEPRMGFEIKAMVLTSICFFYAIVIFLTAAIISTASTSAMTTVSAILKRYQFWNIEHQTKLDVKRTRSRSTKHINQG